MRSKNGKRIKKFCITCNKVFLVHPYRKNAKACSLSCAKEEGKKIRKACPVCFTRFGSYSKEARFCSIKCRAVEIVGERHPRWTGGNWLNIRKIVLLNQDFTCQSCGLRDTEIMQVNHKLPKSRYPELARDIENLETLCPNCHARKTLISKRNNYTI